MARLKCVINFSQEPYVLLKRSPSTPVFDERFVDYGYNKIQLVEHLRHVGYDFLVLMTSYGMDMPDRSSKLRSSFLKRVNDTDSMSSLFMQFRQELAENFTAHPSITLCEKAKYNNVYLPLGDQEL